jgi:hypothetical protein
MTTGDEIHGLPREDRGLVLRCFHPDLAQRCDRDAMTEDTPIQLVIVNGMSADQLRKRLDQEIARWGWYLGVPIPPGFEVKVIDLHHVRIEPDIEDEP